MKLYQTNGYVDIRAIKRLNLPFNFVVGGRGTGKTYTALKTQLEDEETFMFMRRMQSQVDIIGKPEFSPFKPLNCDIEGLNIGTVPITKYNSGFYHMIDDPDKPGKLTPQGLPIGYTCALSTISNMRGFDASDCKTLIFDEFIPERHERPLKNEGVAFLNAYETVNRNRELSGKKPLQVLALANANDLGNPIFLELGLVKKAEKMRREMRNCSIDRDRGVGIFMLTDSPISKRKADTALYRLTEGGAFTKMSLENDFNHESGGKVTSKRLSGYKPVVSIGGICVYENKNGLDFFVSEHESGTPITYSTSEIDRARFKKEYKWLWLEHLCGTVYFESSLCEILLTQYFR